MTKRRRCCCDGTCLECQNFSETFDGTGTLAAIGWTSTGSVSRVSGVVNFLGSDPVASISNSSVGSRLTDNVKTEIDFAITFQGANIVLFVSFNTGARAYIISDGTLMVVDPSGTSGENVIAELPAPVALNTEYILEFCVDDTNDKVYIGIQGIVAYEDSVTNDGLDSFTFAAQIQGEYIPPVPGGEGSYTYPPDTIATVNEVRQFDRVDNSSECCVCGPVEGLQDPDADGTIGDPGTSVTCLTCTDTLSTYLISISSLASGGNIACCSALNDDYLIPFWGITQNTPFACIYHSAFFCEDQPGFTATPGLACCADAFSSIGGADMFSLEVHLEVYGASASLRIRMFVWASATQIKEVWRLSSTTTHDGVDCDTFNFTSFTQTGEVSCDISSLSITAVTT